MDEESLGGALQDAEHWNSYNEAVRGRQVRQLCTDVLRLAGPGAGRTAVDLGCGTGTDTKAMLDAGWNVIAVDGASQTPQLVRDIVGPIPSGRLTLSVRDIAQEEHLPAGDLVYSSLMLPFLPPRAFDRVWGMVRRSVRPEGWLAVNLLGVRDSWAPSPSASFFTESDARRLFDGLDLVRFEEWEEDRPAYRQDVKHWHGFDAIARRSVTSPA